MEQEVKLRTNQGGFILVVVLVITAVGLLFGAGALLLFRFQCEKRIDRQHELEKVYAVRSALNFIRTCADNIDEAGMKFGYRTGSNRDLGLLVKPVEAIFPKPYNSRPDNSKHFDMSQANQFAPNLEQYDEKYDYEYGAFGVTNIVIDGRDKDGKYGLAFKDTVATNSVKWWVNIGMRDTGGWLQEDYGRRYFFQPLDQVKGEHITNDIMRLCIIRNVTNENESAGSRHGWPLLKGERSLVFQMNSMVSGSDTNNAEMTLWEYEHTGAAIRSKRLIYWPNRPSVCPMGVQLAGDRASLFYIGNASKNGSEDDKNLSLSSRGYTFSDSVQLSLDTYRYFSEEITLAGNKTYSGIRTNEVTGKIEAPELRAVFEIEAASDGRKPGVSLNSSNEDFLTNFRVTPAYQYDVFLEHPATVSNRATVAQKIGTYSRGGRGLAVGYTVLTYDTHGTDNKGFRRDERDHANRSGR